MAKLVIFGAFLIGLLAVAQATRFTVTTTITEQKEEQQQHEMGQCMEQIRPQIARLSRCQQYLMPNMPFQIPGTMASKEHDKEQCCEGLQRIRDEQCRCEVMRTAMKDIESTMEKVAQTMPGQQEMQMKKALQSIRQAAENLPNQCNISGQPKCQIEQPSLIRMVMA